jgi:DNA-binding response OmpR family regulator
MDTVIERTPPLHLLLIDPDPEERRIACWHLEREGYRVSQAESGGSALAIFSQDRADLVVLAGAGGLVAGLRELAGRKAISVLLLLGPQELDGEAIVADSGADDFLVRPARPSELLVRVRVLARLKRARDASRDLTHDMKNPLSAILANCQYLMRHVKLEPEAREVVGDIASSAGHLGRMLDIEHHQAGWGKSPGRANR